MSDIAPENDTYDKNVEMPEDLSGNTLNIHFYSLLDQSVTQGGSTSGGSKGETVTITTDLQSKSIDPGVYQLEVTYDDSGTTREVSLDDRIVKVRNAESV